MPVKDDWVNGDTVNATHLNDVADAVNTNTDAVTTNTTDIAAVTGNLQPKRYGLLPGRRMEAAADGTGTTAMTSFGSSTANAIPLATLVSSTGGFTVASNKLVLPSDVPPMKYTAHVQVRFQGGSSSIRSVYIRRVGDSSELFWRGQVDAGTTQIAGDGDVVLNPGDQLSIDGYTETGSVTVVDRGFGVGDVRVTLRSLDLLPVRSCLVGYAGAAVPGVAREIYGDWGLHNTWFNLSQGIWDTPLLTWIAANPTKAVNFACGLIPHGGTSSASWNTTLDEVTAGTHDARFTTLGTNLGNQAPKTLYLRPWWEVDQDSTRVNVNPAKFKAAWHRAVPLIRTAFAAAAPTKTLKIVYSYLGTSDYSGSMDYYPTSETDVDVLGSDIYAWIWGSGVPTWPVLAKAVQTRLETLAVNARAHSKPFGLDEWGTGVITGGGSPGSWGRKDEPLLSDLYFNWVEQNAPEYILNFNIEGAGSHSLANTPNLAERLKQRHGLLTP
jgi:hypothetical protein